MSELLTIEELSQKLKIKESWVYSRTRMKGENTIPCLRVGKYCRFDLEEVVDWLKDNINLTKA
jgi:excisionase family DNA binding protein